MGTASPFADVECLALAYEILKGLKVDGVSQLEINSIGDEESRAAYLKALVEYLEAKKTSLSPDSQKRLTINPMRILDSKDPGDQALLTNAPVISDFYNAVSKEFFGAVTASLSDFGIPYKLNPFLVRGLDYYCHSVFEFKTNALGAQDAILSGGRYDNLVKIMGGPVTPSVGWAAGVERLVMLSPLEAPKPRPVAIVPVHASVEGKAFQIAYQLRAAGLFAEIGFSGNMSKRMKRAADRGSYATVLIGPDELQNGKVMIKTMDSGQQETVDLVNLEKFLKDLA